MGDISPTEWRGGGSRLHPGSKLVIGVSRANTENFRSIELSARFMSWATVLPTTSWTSAIYSPLLLRYRKLIKVPVISGHNPDIIFGREMDNFFVQKKFEPRSGYRPSTLLRWKYEQDTFTHFSKKKWALFYYRGQKLGSRVNFLDVLKYLE